MRLKTVIDNKKIKDFISKSPQGTIFTSPEWLEAVSPGSWEYLVVEKNESITICIPIIRMKKYGFSILNMPPLTQSLGVLLPIEEGKYAEALSRNMNRINELLAQLPSYSYFMQRFHPEYKNWLPFYWHGFKQTTRYTYIIEDLSSIDDVWNGLRSNIRQEIRKAEKQLVIEQSNDLNALIFCIKSTFERQGGIEFSFKTLERIFQTCSNLDCGKIFLARNKKGDLCGGIYIVWDNKSSYYLSGGSHEQFRTTGAMPFLIWEAIRFSSKITKQFNFEGSMIKPIERFFRAFGAKQIPYFEISKSNSIFINIYKYFTNG